MRFRGTVIAIAILTLTCATPSAADLLSLNWTDNATDEDGFLVERADNPSGPFAELAHVTADTTAYYDLSTTSGRSYCYRVRAFNAAGISDSSNVECGIAASPALPIISVDVLVDGPTIIVSAILVPGTTPTLVDVYIVLRAPDGSFFSLVAADTLAPGIVPAATHFSPIPFTGEVFRYTFTGTEPHGTYRWYAVLANAGAPTLVGNFVQSSFAR